MKFLSVIVIFISMINFGYAFETIEKSMDLFELEIVDFEEQVKPELRPNILSVWLCDVWNFGVVETGRGPRTAG